MLGQKTLAEDVCHLIEDNRLLVEVEPSPVRLRPQDLHRFGWSHWLLPLNTLEFLEYLDDLENLDNLANLEALAPIADPTANAIAISFLVI